VLVEGDDEFLSHRTRGSNDCYLEHIGANL
jgi:hypothetical protein